MSSAMDPSTEEYQSSSSNSTLTVFCVGNRDYDMECTQIWGPKVREIAIPGSSIPQLRKHCHSNVAKAQFRLSDHFLGVQVPDLVQSLEVRTASAEHGAPLDIPHRSSIDKLISVLPATTHSFQQALWEKVDIFSDSLNNQLKIQILDFWRMTRPRRCLNQGG